ncbi:DUF6716 putative glycosyltransferase [Streptomyces sp. CA-253872]|uniref:DUF6716 putative glycosyltransferase n=1 Tax=Streptomyces sp. CA-253872 TaxID=3240067 RepID=UPI003D8AD913
MSESKPKSLRVAVLADSDTRWKWGALTAARVTGCEEPDGFLLRGRATPTARQLREVGVRAASLREVTANGFVRAVGETRYDVVVLALVGGGVQALVHGLRYAWQGAAKRPVLVTGYVGVVYEKLADGLLLRHGADVVLANSRDDAERFRAVYEGVGADSASVVECALPFLQGEPATGNTDGPVVFAVQPSVPERRADRLYLLRRAAQHARLHPEREVLVKLRSRPGEHTTHIEEQPYQKLARAIELPPNCRLEYGHMGTILDTASLLVTVSSTAALEALHRGVPTAVLTDLGIREALGNHAFLGSGCLTSWDALDAGHLPKADPAWAARQGVASDRPYESAFDAARARITALLARPQLPPLSPYYTLATAPGYLPGILARHHLAPDGSPLPGAPSDARPPGPLKQVVRQAARGAYRHGVQRVAPVIRRMGEL